MASRRRRGGKVEERLRAAVLSFARSKHGNAKIINELVHGRRNWLNAYESGQLIGIDTSLALMRFLGWTLTKDLADIVEPPIDSQLVVALRDEKIVRLVMALSRAETEYKAALTTTVHARTGLNTLSISPVPSGRYVAVLLAGRVAGFDVSGYVVGKIDVA